MHAAWFQPVSADLYEDVYRVHKKDLLEVYCINPNDYSMVLANEGEIVKLKDAVELTASIFLTAAFVLGA